MNVTTEKLLYRDCYLSFDVSALSTAKFDLHTISTKETENCLQHQLYLYTATQINDKFYAIV